MLYRAAGVGHLLKDTPQAGAGGRRPRTDSRRPGSVDAGWGWGERVDARAGTLSCRKRRARWRGAGARRRGGAEGARGGGADPASLAPLCRARRGGWRPLVAPTRCSSADPSACPGRLRRKVETGGSDHSRSDTQMTPFLWQKVKKNQRTS